MLGIFRFEKKLNDKLDDGDQVRWSRGIGAKGTGKARDTHTQNRL